MSDTKQSAVIRYEQMPPPKTRGNQYDLEATLMAIREIPEGVGENAGAVIAEGVSASWANSNKLAKELKAKGCKIRSHKLDSGKFVVYAQIASEAPKGVKAAA